MKTLIYVTALASCAVVPSQPPQCITRCGMYSEVECGRMQTAEDVGGRLFARCFCTGLAYGYCVLRG